MQTLLLPTVHTWGIFKSLQDCTFPQALLKQCQPGGKCDFYISSTQRGNILNFICLEVFFVIPLA